MLRAWFDGPVYELPLHCALAAADCPDEDDGRGRALPPCVRLRPHGRHVGPRPRALRPRLLPQVD